MIWRIQLLSAIVNALIKIHRSTILLLEWQMLTNICATKNLWATAFPLTLVYSDVNTFVTLSPQPVSTTLRYLSQRGFAFHYPILPIAITWLCWFSPVVSANIKNGTNFSCANLQMHSEQLMANVRSQIFGLLMCCFCSRCCCIWELNARTTP